MKKLFSLLTLALLTLSAWAADPVTIDFTALGYQNGQEVSSLTVSDVTVTFDKGTSNNTPKYYNTGTAVRVYGGNSFSVSCSKANIVGVTMTFASGEGTNAITSSVGTYENGTWTGDASSITFTVGGTSGHRRIQKMEVTLAEPSGNFVAAPVFDPASCNFGGSIQVSLTCATEGAEIIYMINGGQEQTYNAPITLYQTATIKAYAQTEDGESSMAEAIYTLLPSVATVAEANALTKGSKFFFTGNAIAVYQSGNYLYVKDDTGSGLIFGYNLPDIAEGKTLKSGWDAEFDNYNGLPEYKNPNKVEATEAEAVAIVADEYTVAQIDSAMVNQRVIIKGVTLAAGSGDKYMIADGTLTLYNQFSINYPETSTLADNTFNIEGMVGYHNGLQLLPINITLAGGGEIITVKKPTISPASQSFTESIKVSIKSTEEDVTLYYNFDNSENWIEYTDTLVITETTTVYAKAVKSGVDSEIAKATYTKLEPQEEMTYALVTDAAQLADGDKIILVGYKGETPYAIAESRSNNFGSVAVTIAEDGKITTDMARPITLEANGNYWNLKAAEGYLYAASSKDNHMKVEEAVDTLGNANASIAITDTATAVIVFNGSNSHNIVRFNASNNPPLFSCYEQGKQTPVYIYKAESDAPVVIPGDVNNDGEVGIADVAALIDHLLSGDFTASDNFNPLNADVNQADGIGIADVSALIDLLLNS